MRPAPPDGALDRKVAALYGIVAGVDEAGRGALAGPVTVAAVILDPAAPIPGVDDSKKLSPAKRSRLASLIQTRALAWMIVERSAADVDEINVLEATRAAMTEAVASLLPQPACVISDAVALPRLAMRVIAEPHADARYQCVAAASILAKVARDGAMAVEATRHPGYGWERNKGYGTREHLEALRRLGPSPIHRRSFAPIRMLG